LLSKGTSWSAFTGLNAGFETGVNLPGPANTVDITLVHFAQPATVNAIGGSGGIVDTETMTLPGGTAETLHLAGGGIEVLTVVAPSDETLILKICAAFADGVTAVQPKPGSPELADQLTGPASTEALSAGESVENRDQGTTAENAAAGRADDGEPTSSMLRPPMATTGSHDALWPSRWR
jgi:hypothetical protein